MKLNYFDISLNTCQGQAIVELHLVPPDSDINYNERTVSFSIGKHEVEQLIRELAVVLSVKRSIRYSKRFLKSLLR